ncbi:MAG: sigma-70 family RNA polymerase sigma factor [Clostridia bacterium]|nr:sigma-70 family RNA polymerase sigma factor [Clostridia bacterium]
MEDKRIIELFWERSEAAIKESAKKYGRYLRRIAFNVLGNEQDCEEVENDTYLRAWNSIPPEKPSSLKGYLAVICRNLACNRYNINTAKKRGEHEKALSELSDAVPEDDGRDLAESVALRQAVEKFLLSLDEKTRNIFLQRYFYLYPLSAIAKGNGMKESTVSMLLFRTRKKLKEHLQKEDIDL